MVRYWNDVVQKPVEDFFSLPSVTDSTAAGLKTLINEEFTSAVPGDEGLFSKTWKTKACIFKNSRQAFVV